MSDDVSMGALSGSLGERSQAALAAGCDLVLHCNGRMDEMVAVAASSPVLSGRALARTQRALALRGAVQPVDVAAARAQFAALMGVQAVGAVA
jgi:beta-N-acetylhexosaminidase